MPKLPPAERLEATMLLTTRRVRARPEVKARLADMPPSAQASHLAELAMEELRRDADALALMHRVAEGVLVPLHSDYDGLLA
jgi:hypothetical protein